MVVVEAELAFARHALDAAVVFLDHLVCDIVLVAIKAVSVPAGQRVCLHLAFRQAADVACELLLHLDTLIASKEEGERSKKSEQEDESKNNKKIINEEKIFTLGPR